MAVFRIEKNKNYTVMANYHLRDISLSLKAKGLLSLMLFSAGGLGLHHQGACLHLQGRRGQYLFHGERAGKSRICPA